MYFTRCTCNATWASALQIRVLGWERVTKGFDARTQCDRRRYEYLLPASAFRPDPASAKPAQGGLANGEAGAAAAAGAGVTTGPAGQAALQPAMARRIVQLKGQKHRRQQQPAGRLARRMRAARPGAGQWRRMRPQRQRRLRQARDQMRGRPTGPQRLGRRRRQALQRLPTPARLQGQG